MPLLVPLELAAGGKLLQAIRESIDADAAARPGEPSSPRPGSPRIPGQHAPWKRSGGNRGIGTLLPPKRVANTTSALPSSQQKMSYCALTIRVPSMRELETFRHTETRVCGQSRGSCMATLQRGRGTARTLKPSNTMKTWPH
eukprot:9492983-Pyramimonas_sp.AAC.1